MKHSKQELEYKRYLEIERITNDLQDKIKAIPYVKMDKAIQDGWFIDIEITPEVMRSEYGPKYAEVLAFFTSPYTLPKSKSNVIGAIRKLKLLSKCRDLFTIVRKEGTVYVGPALHSISEQEYKKIPEHLQKYVYRSETQHVSRWGGATYTTVRYHCNLPRYILQLRVRKRMLTMIKNIDPELESEHAFYERLRQELGQKYWGHWSYDIRSPRNIKYQRPKIRDRIRHFLMGNIDDDKL